MNYKLRLGYWLKLYENGEEVLNVQRKVKRRIVDAVQGRSWNKAYIKVSYDNEFYNDGEYTNIKDFMQALDVFTEKSLIDFARS